jgi:hypothetical protein
MPGQTPVWAIRYPYIGEVIAPGAFKNLADDVDAALDTIAAAGTAAANGRRYVKLTRAEGPDTIATGIDANIVWTTQLSADDPGAWWTSGANIVLPAKGLYHVSVWNGQHAGVTTVFSQMLRVAVNGVFRLGKRPYRNSGGIAENDGVSGVVYCSTAGHALTAAYRWVGTGGPAAFPDCGIEVTQLLTLP